MNNYCFKNAIISLVLHLLLILLYSLTLSVQKRFLTIKAQSLVKGAAKFLMSINIEIKLLATSFSHATSKLPKFVRK